MSGMQGEIMADLKEGYMPDAVLFQLLPYLPARAVLRVRAVSKQWLDMVDEVRSSTYLSKYGAGSACELVWSLCAECTVAPQLLYMLCKHTGCMMPW